MRERVTLTPNAVDLYRQRIAPPGRLGKAPRGSI